MNTFRLPLRHLSARLRTEASRRGCSPESLALAAICDACGLKSIPNSGAIEILPGDAIHPKLPILLLQGTLVDEVKRVARTWGTCTSVFLRWRLGEFLGDDY